jgi:hypothetical protein
MTSLEESMERRRKEREAKRAQHEAEMKALGLASATAEVLAPIAASTQRVKNEVVELCPGCTKPIETVGCVESICCFAVV